jgi:hypothetical protein
MILYWDRSECTHPSYNVRIRNDHSDQKINDNDEVGRFFIKHFTGIFHLLAWQVSVVPGIIGTYSATL